MTATAAQILEVRRLTNEPTTTTYSDALIQSFIERYPLMDELGVDPYYFTQTGSVPTKTTNVNWIATYDLAAAASDIWTEKAAVVAARFDFTADGGNYTQSQEYLFAMQQAKYFRGRRSIKTARLVTSPSTSPADASWIGNLPEPL